MHTRKLSWDSTSQLETKNLAPGLLCKSKEKNKGLFSLSSYKEALEARFVKKLFDKKACTKSRKRKTTFCCGRCIFKKENKFIFAKFSVTISRRYVMYVILYHYSNNLWNSAMFACIIDFRNCQLLESEPCHCGANSIELTTMICNFVILISCSIWSQIPDPFFTWWWEKTTGLFGLIRYYFVWSDTLKQDLEKKPWSTTLFRLLT